MAHDITTGEAIQQWIDDRLAEAPPITPEQAAKLSDLLADARTDAGWSDADSASLSRR